MIENLKPTLGEAATNIIDGIDALIPGTKLSEQIGKIETFSDELIEKGKMTSETLNQLATVLDSNATPAAKKLAETALIDDKVLRKDGGGLSEDFAKALQKIRTDNEKSQSPTDTEGSSLGLFDKFMKSIGLYDKGTLGETGSLFKDFGKGQAAMLHGLEAVVPKSSPQGALLDSFPGGLSDLTSQMKNMGSKFDPSAMAAATAGQQSAPPKVLQDLMTDMSSPSTSTQGNTNEDLSESISQHLQQLIQINSRQLAEIQKQVKATKGMNGNMMSNVGL